MDPSRSTAISVPPTSTTVSQAVERAADHDALEQRDRMLEYTERVRGEHGLGRDGELRERLRANAAGWLD